MNAPPTIWFPSGNTTFARHLVRALIPDSTRGNLSFTDILKHSVDLGALDRRNAATRIRLNATVIHVEHQGSGVAVIYEREGKLYRTTGRVAVVASPGWVNRHTIADLPGEISRGLRRFSIRAGHERQRGPHQLALPL